MNKDDLETKEKKKKKSNCVLFLSNLFYVLITVTLK